MTAKRSSAPHTWLQCFTFKDPISCASNDQLILLLDPDCRSFGNTIHHCAKAILVAAKVQVHHILLRSGSISFILPKTKIIKSRCRCKIEPRIQFESKEIRKIRHQIAGFSQSRPLISFLFNLSRFLMVVILLMKEHNHAETIVAKIITKMLPKCQNLKIAFKSRFP